MFRPSRPCPRRRLRAALALVAAPLLLLALVALDLGLRADVAEAQSNGTRSINRGPGSASSLGSRARRSVGSGFDTTSSSASTVRRSSPSDADGDEDPRWENDGDRDDEEHAAEPDDDRDREANEADDDEPPRSMHSGPACIHGADGEVIYRPRGAVCRGDRGSAVDEAPQRAQPRKRSAADPVPARRAPAAREEPRQGGGTCMYGGNGEVIYASPGAVCR